MTKSKVGLFIAMVCLSGQGAHGQGKDPISAGFLSDFRSDVDSGGSLQVDRWDISGGVPVVKNETVFAALTASYAVAQYDFSDSVDLWGRVSQISLGAPVSWQLNEKWKWSSVIRVGSSLESGASSSDSFNYGVVTSFNYKFSDTLTLGPGFSYFSELEDDASVFPILSIDWKFAPNWKLATGPSAGANSGANVYVNYTLNDQWNFSLGTYFQSQRFRLASDSSISPDGVGEERYIAAYAVAQYAPVDNLAVSLIGGYGFARELEVFDERGAELIEEDLDAAPFLGLRLSYKF